MPSNRKSLVITKAFFAKAIKAAFRKGVKRGRRENGIIIDSKVLSALGHLNGNADTLIKSFREPVKLPESPVTPLVAAEIQAEIELAKIIFVPPPIPTRFATTQVQVTGPALAKCQLLTAAIAPEDLAAKGIEDDVHCTARYGLHTDDPREVARIVSTFGPMNLHLGSCSVFPGVEYDVLCVSVFSPDLVRLNDLLGQMPHTDTHPEYVPHVSLAYVKPGLGQTYADMMPPVDEQADVAELVFSSADKMRTIIPLTCVPDSGAVPWLNAGGNIEDYARKSMPQIDPRTAFLEASAPEPTLATLEKSIQHAPAGGVDIGGKTFAGGEFIPADVLAGATDEEKAKLEDKKGGGEDDEWDGVVVQDEVSDGDDADDISTYNTWSGTDKTEHIVRLVDGTFETPQGDTVDVWRWESLDGDGDVEDHGEWTDNKREAISDGERHARHENKEPPDPEDSDIDDVSGQSWGDRDQIATYNNHNNETRSVRIEEGTFEFAGESHDCYRWTTRQDEDGDWTLDRRQAERDGETYAEEENYDEESDGENKWEEMMGDADPLEICGALSGSSFSIEAYGEKVEVRIKHPKIQDCLRTFGKDARGNLFVHNDLFVVKSEYREEGIGADVFSAQVQACAAAGVSWIECHAAGPPINRHMNGYFTWPRFGYDQDIDDFKQDEQAKIRERFPEAKSVLDIMATAEGREWWGGKKNPDGTRIPGTANGINLLLAKFDLTPGSRSMKVLAAYLEETKGKREVLTKSTSTRSRRWRWKGRGPSSIKKGLDSSDGDTIVLAMLDHAEACMESGEDARPGLDTLRAMANGQRFNKAWDESSHPRGQSDNAGEFASKEGGDGKDGVAATSDDESVGPDSDDYVPEFSKTDYYHGTNDAIDAFKNATGRGISFTDNPHHSDEFGGNLYKVRLSAKNPIDLTSLGSGAGEGDGQVSTDQIKDALEQYGIRIKVSRNRQGWTTDLLRPFMPEIIQQASAMGYDAVVVDDFKEFEATETVVFDPKQIKVVGGDSEGMSVPKEFPVNDKGRSFTVEDFRDMADDQEYAEAEREGITDPEQLKLFDAHLAYAKAPPDELEKAAKWDESKHPRSKTGQFISRDRIDAAKTDPKLAAKLRKEVKPEDAGKLDAALEGKTDLGRTARGQAKHEAGERRKVKEGAKERGQALMAKLARSGEMKYDITHQDLQELADHLGSEHVTVAELRATRHALIGGLAKRIGWEGAKRKEQMAKRLVEFVKGQVSEARVKDVGHGKWSTLEGEDLKPGDLFSRPRREAIAGIKEAAPTNIAIPAEEPQVEVVPPTAPEPTLAELETKQANLMNPAWEKTGSDRVRLLQGMADNPTFRGDTGNVAEAIANYANNPNHLTSPVGREVDRLARDLIAKMNPDQRQKLADHYRSMNGRNPDVAPAMKEVLAANEPASYSKIRNDVVARLKKMPGLSDAQKKEFEQRIQSVSGANDSALTDAAYSILDEAKKATKSPESVPNKLDNSPKGSDTTSVEPGTPPGDATEGKKMEPVVQGLENEANAPFQQVAFRDMLRSVPSATAGEGRSLPRAIKQALMFAMEGGYDPAHAADEMIKVGYPRELVVADMERRVPYLSEGGGENYYADPKRTEQAIASIRSWLTRTTTGGDATDGKKMETTSAKKVHGRTPTEGKKPQGFTRKGRNQAEVGEVFQANSGQRYVVTKTSGHYVSNDDIEDQDAWSSYPDGPGYYTSFYAHPVEPTAEETTHDEAAAAKVKAAADEKASQKSREEAAWAPVAGHKAIERGSLPGIPSDIKWEQVSKDTYGNNGYGTTRYIATLPNGEKIGKSVNTSYDDHREALYVPQHMADEYAFHRAHETNRTLAENERLAADPKEYYSREAKDFLAAHERATPERREKFAKMADSMTRMHTAAPDQQWPEAQRHYQEHGQHFDRGFGLPTQGRADFDRAQTRLNKDIETRVPDAKIRIEAEKQPGYAEARREAIWGDNPKAMDDFLARAVPIATAKIQGERDANKAAWSNWYESKKPALEAAIAKVVPPELIAEALDYVHSQTVGKEGGDPASKWGDPETWAKDVKEGLASEDSGFEEADFPGLHGHGKKIQQAAKDAEAERKAKAKATKAANPDHVVSGNTFPHKDKIKALGGRWKDGQWVIPASAASRLPRGLTSRPIK